jgi:hypothetical protein
MTDLSPARFRIAMTAVFLGVVTLTIAALHFAH